VVFDVDSATRAEQFRFFAESLKSNRLRTYVGMMVKAGWLLITSSRPTLNLLLLLRASV
jgi:hypothetical protein